MSKRLLLVEDDPVSARILERALAGAGYSVTLVTDGRQGITHLQAREVDIVVTDWMMPDTDGIALIHWIRSQKRPAPLVVMLTSLDSPNARSHALHAGADEFLTKPTLARDLLIALENGMARRVQPQPTLARPAAATATAPARRRPPLVGIGVAASTGGPDVLAGLLATLRLPPRAAVFVVQHGPPWMLESLAERLKTEITQTDIVVAGDGVRVEPGLCYVAPGDNHLAIRAPGALHLSREPPINFVRPSADHLFRSMARFFGAYAVAVVLTGLGRDGALGAAEMAAAGARVLVQDPATAVAPSMPQTVLHLVPDAASAAAGRLGTTVSAMASKLQSELERASAELPLVRKPRPTSKRVT